MKSQIWLVATLFGAIFASEPVTARSLQQIRDSGSVVLCAHPNSLPFASKTAETPGFQVELARALAAQLGVSLGQEWIVSPSQVFRSNCDMVLDVIGDQSAQSESGLQVSKPYYRGGVGLAVPHGSPVHSIADLNEHTKVGVQVGSTMAMLLNQRHVGVSMFAFEDEMMEALAAREIDAAAVTATVAGYFNATHPEQAVNILPPDDTRADMAWNLAVGLRRPDAQLREAIDAALERLRNDGTVAAIYARYGVSIRPPE
jgi:polar amino acid transport system substrate-binding protein